MSLTKHCTPSETALILCTVYLEHRWDCLSNLSIMIALMCVQIPPSPDNFKRAIEYQIFQTPFYNGFESVANIVFSFETNFGWGPIQSYQTVATSKGN